MKFTKVHGLGNDFVLLDGRTDPNRDWNALTARICDRHTGVGGDGTLIVLNSDSCDIRMRIINADGSEAEMCGNGIRAFAKYVFENGIVRGTEFSVETGAGVMRPRIILSGGRITGVCVDMGVPLTDCTEIPAIGEGPCLNRGIRINGELYFVSAVRVGVPHAVVFVPSLLQMNLQELGPLIEHSTLFPQRANVNFVEVLDRTHVRMRTWERGCGQTLACGTGACSTAVICSLLDRTERHVFVELQLGTLEIEWADDGHVYMTGPAETVFTGILTED